MASPVPHPADSESARAAVSPTPRAPDADPVAIRACLTPDVAAVFDREWEFVLEAAKESKNLAGVRELLGKWRHFAYRELAEPGNYFGLLAAAARTQATGQPPRAASRPTRSEPSSRPG